MVPDPHDPGNAVHRLGRVLRMLRHGVFRHGDIFFGMSVRATSGVAFLKFR